MGKASSGKKVARAASTGGGRTSRGKTPWGWYGAISLVVVLGMVLIVTSRNETLDRLGERGSEHPTTEEHWHSAYGFYFCDQFSPPLADNGRDPLGIHTHGDGIIHVHPFSQAASGNRATLDKFEDTMGINISRDKLEIGDRKYSNGDKCGDKPGEVRVLVDGEPFTGDPSDIKFTDRQALVIAFAPKDVELPKQPPSFAGLNNLTDVPGGGAPPSGVPNDATSSTSTPAGTQDGSTSTSSPPGSTPPPDPTATTSSSTP
jgi:hypothetical protein